MGTETRLGLKMEIESKFKMINGSEYGNEHGNGSGHGLETY